MHWPDKKLMAALFAAGAVSFLAGFAYVKLIGQLPCSGETLVCNINEAIGAYGVVIWAILGPLIFALVLAIARNRAALIGAAIVLHVTSFVPVTLLGLWFALRDGLSLQRIKQVTESSEPVEVKA